MDEQLHINDLFWTWQGEGLHAGRRALFVRMPFCNLACAWCDTAFNDFKHYSQEEFEAAAEVAPAINRFAVVTGGEPIMHKHTPMVLALLKSMHFQVACESNGTIDNPELYRAFDFVTISPKRQTQDKKMDPYFISESAIIMADEFKYVVDKEFDFKILKRHDTNDGRRYSLSPEFTQMSENIERIKEWTSQNPVWRISMQTHKWIGIK